MKVENLGRESCTIYELRFTICFIADLRIHRWPCNFRLDCQNNIMDQQPPGSTMFGLGSDFAI